MANAEHLNWLLEGVNSWNARRRQEPFDPELDAEDVSRRLGVQEREDIREIGAQLRGINLSGANLTDSTLRDTDLSSSQLSLASLNRANLVGSRFDRSVLAGTKFRSAKMISASLADARIFHSDFAATILAGANISGTQFWECNLQRAHLYSADMTGTDFIRSKPWEANLFWKPGQTILEPVELDVDTIDGLDDLLSLCRQLRSAYGDDVVLYFRGESKEFDELRPSVMRKDENGKFPLRSFESEMLNDLLTRQPDAFSGLSSALAEWVIAQHHQLNTRLLDVTRNPQVAIFFACNGDGGKDGRLHVFAVPKSIIKPFNSEEVAVISNFAKLPRTEQNLLLGKTESDAIGDVYPAEARGIGEGIRLFALAKAHHHSTVRRERPDIQENIDIRDLFRVFVVEPQQTFERIRAQSGAFLLSAFHDRFERTEILKANPETPVYGHHVLRIPYARKTDLLDDLSMLNVRLETLFPGIDQTARTITQSYRNRSR